MEDNFNFSEIRQLEQISLKQISEMVELLFVKRAELEERQKALDEESKELEIVKQKVISILADHNQTEFSHKQYGKVYTQTKFQVSMPKDPAKSAALRAYFAKRGMEDMLTVNHMTLNSLYNSIKDEKEANGEPIVLNEIIPGVEEPTARVVLAMKKVTK